MRVNGLTIERSYRVGGIGLWNPKNSAYLGVFPYLGTPASGYHTKPLAA